MRLIKCKKCGASMVTEDALIERMQDSIHEIVEKANRERNKENKNAYLEEAKSIRKMMQGILHNTANIHERQVTCSLELSEIVHYITSNNLVTYEKLDELRAIARKKAVERNKKDSKEIERIYGTYKSLYTPANKTKKDPTAKEAMKEVKK